MSSRAYRQTIVNYIQSQAKPPDKFSHQPRLYELAVRVAGKEPFDDDIVFAAAWLHDLGVFVGHRPEDLAALAAWDNVAYAVHKTPELLREFGFPSEKVPGVVAAIATHLPSAKPTTYEGTLLRDADILEQLGAISVLRSVSKVGRDTRFVYFSDALKLLRRNMEQLPGQLRLESARALAQPRIAALKSFLDAAESDSLGMAL